MIRSALFSMLFLTSAAFAQTREITDDAGRQVTVPESPQRIVSMHDLDLTIPLIELGVMPVASHGRMGLDGKPYMRSSPILTGIDFDNSDIAYIGSVHADIEAIIAARPDLILTEPGRATPVEQLEKIAPTVVIDNTIDGAPHIYARLADLTGTQARLEVLERRYAEQLAQLREAVDAPTISVSVMQSQNGKIAVYHTYRALGRVLRDAGFRFPALIDDIPAGQRIEVSAERLPELDADYIFATYRSDTGGVPADEIAAMNGVMPGFCDFLRACGEGRYILLPREEAISNSYAGLALMVAVVQSQISGRQQGAELRPD
ncbi:MAG TPA: ABC transporter substrate-binding protein [Paracoccus sp. (in: a-proteobacteria)]|nr:ABC transporter substrate-binding protein [Paracoccus sp. (in: a-proteobacteria)]